jgi:glycosyltransferase involved in cell wall biosynthesis
MATRICKQLPKPDIVFATHTPLTVGLTGINLKKHYNIPFVFEVRDLWPEALVNIGSLRNPLAILWLKQMSRKIYHEADHITAASPGMKKGVLKYGIPKKKVTVITQGCDLSIFNPNNKATGIREHLGIGTRFAAIYFGAMGHANGLDYVVEAAEILEDRGRKDILIILHGDGGKKKELKAMVSDKNISNVIFSDPVPDKKDLAKIVAACDACLTIYNSTKERTWSPNKMFDALAAGRPVVINVPGWLGRTIEDNECGILTDPNSPDALADALEKLADSTDLRRHFGNKARSLAEGQFSRTKMGKRLEKVLLETINEYVI